MFKKTRFGVCFFRCDFLFVVLCFLGSAFCVHSEQIETQENIGFSTSVFGKEIRSIVFEGLCVIDKTVVYEALPKNFKSGLVISENISSSGLIKSLMKTGLFETVKLLKKEKDSFVDFKFVVTEKKILGEYEILGEPQTISSKKIVNLLNLKNTLMICESDLKKMISRIVDEFRKKAVFDVKVEASLFPKENALDEVNLKINIKEGEPVLIRTINFVGCKNLDPMFLRKRLFCREAWPLRVAFGGGVYSPEIVDSDKQMISKIFSDLGYCDAKVTDVFVEKNMDEPTVNLTFFIEEGSRYKVRLLSLVNEDESLSPSTLRKIIPLKRGDWFSLSKLQASSENIKNCFSAGNFLFCDVYPELKTGLDSDGSPVVDVFFSVDKGEQVKINNINITGNTKTHENVIRRELNIFEGGMANKIAMDSSLRRLMALGYFDSSSLDWKVTQKDSNSVDLDLDLKEVKTGNASLQLQFKRGSTAASTGANSHQQGDVGNSFSASLVGVYRKRNLLGLGWDLNANVSFNGTSFNGLDFDFFNPYLFNKNLCLGFKVYGGVQEYKEYGRFFKDNHVPREQSQGVLTSFGCYLFPHGARIKASLDLGYDIIGYSSYVIDPSFKNYKFSKFLESRLKDGSFGWCGLQFTKDTLNHPLYPSSGWRVNLNLKALPEQGQDNQRFGMYKTELSGTCCAPLIGKDTLVFSAMGKLGMVLGKGNDSVIPFRDLFMFGGTDTIRGFSWGEAGPIDRRLHTVLGAKKMLLGRFELISTFSKERDFDINTPRFYLFYDIGTAWDSPALDVLPNVVDKSKNYVAADVLKNSFNLRQTVGFGIRLTVPQPVKIEWGFKLDKDRKSNERPAEWHLCVNMPMEF